MDERVVLHVDMDAFFASVEVLDDPTLEGLPVIVGGSGRRGVVAACTYEARRFGVHSAMPSAVARRLCPSAIILDGRYHRYSEESAKLHAILESVTPLVEGISLDEAFLDVTGCPGLRGDGRTLAEQLRAQVTEDLGLACSVGVGRSKLVAKLASKAAKPVASLRGVEPGPGVVVVSPEGEPRFLARLPARALPGVGPVTGRKLERLGVATVAELASLPVGVLERSLGRAAGRHLDALARGDDPRPVVAAQAAKSIGHEETFAEDLWDRDVLGGHLVRLADASAGQLRRSGLTCRTVNIKVRFADFTVRTRSHSVSGPVDASPAIVAVARELFDGLERDQGVRLLGVSLSGLFDRTGGVQLALDLDDDSAAAGSAGAARLQSAWGSVTEAVDAVRARFGGRSVGPASLVRDDGLALRGRGDAQWGPAGPAARGAGERAPKAL